MFKVTWSLNGEGMGVWEDRSGGERDSEAFQHKAGALGKSLSLGGKATVGNITLSKLYTDVEHAKLQKMLNAVGGGDTTVSQQPLSPDGAAWGRPIVWTGTLKRVTPPGTAAQSTDAAMIEVEIVSDDEIKV